jgi:hypothetical protein
LSFFTYYFLPLPSDNVILLFFGASLLVCRGSLNVFINSLYNFPVPPQIHPFDFGDDTINSGDVIIAICAVTKGDFPIKIRWTLNNQPLENFGGITTMNTNKRASQLTIESVQAHHAGEFKCIAENKAGFAEFSTYLNVNGILFTDIFPFFFLPSRPSMVPLLSFLKRCLPLPANFFKVTNFDP